MSTEAPRVLIVEDEAAIARIYETVLKNTGHPEAAIDTVDQGEISLDAIVDRVRKEVGLALILDGQGYEGGKTVIDLLDALGDSTRGALAGKILVTTASDTLKEDLNRGFPEIPTFIKTDIRNIFSAIQELASKVTTAQTEAA